MTLLTSARTEASDGKDLCFVHWCTASSVPGMQYAFDNYVLVELAFNQVELCVCYMLGRRVRGNEFWASLLCITEVQSTKKQKPLNEGSK